MSTNRQGLLNKLPTLAACLCREARVDSSHSMTNSCSLVFEDVEKRAPTGVHDALCQMMVLDHVGDSQVFNRNQLIALGVRFSCLKMMVAALSIDLEMCLRGVLRGFTAAVAAFLASAHNALLPSQCALGCAIEARVLNRVSLAISQKRLQSNINTDVGMRTGRRFMLAVWKYLTHDERIPVSISAQHQVDGFGGSLNRAVQLDLNGLADLGWHDEMFLILMQIAVFPILPQLDTMPAVRRLEAWETHIGDTVLFCGKKPLEGPGKPISQHLYGGRWHMFALPFERRLKIIFAGKRLLLLILCFNCLKHPVVDATRFYQARYELVLLFLIREKAVFKCPHGHILP